MSPRALLLCLGLALGGSELRGSRGERVVTRHFASELELATGTFELSGSQDGHTVDQAGPSTVREQADEIEIEDTWLDDEDPPGKFSRYYRAVTSSFRMGAEDAPKERITTAGVAKKTVVFERQEDGSWERSSEDDDVRPVQMKRLRAELSLRVFLPEGEPEVGASWEIAPAELLRLVSPLEEGKHRRPKGKAAPAGKRGMDLAPVALTEPIGSLLAELDGSLEATRLAASADDEWPCQARLVFRVNSTFDGSANLIRDRASEVEDELQLGYEGTGLLAWDPASGRIEVTCQGDLRLRETFRAQVEGNGKTGEMRGSLEVAGTLTLEASE